MTQHVGVRELKARLSYYIKKASQGERVIVTDRGEPVAVINPVPKDRVYDPAEDAIWKLVAEGKVRWGGGKPKGLSPGIKMTPGKSAAEMIIEDREDRG